MSKFVVGERVKIINYEERTAALVLEVISNEESGYNESSYSYSYKIKYDEGSTLGNDGTGYWPENSLYKEV